MTRLDTELMRFSASMRRKLAANAHKQGWELMSPDALTRRLMEEVSELLVAFWSNSSAVADEAADVANFCMFMAYAARRP